MEELNLQNYRKALCKYLVEGGQLKVIMLHLSSKCNSNCKNCYRNVDASGLVRTLEESIFLIKKFKRQGFRVMPEMAELLPETAHLLKAFKLAKNPEISTNGESILNYPYLIDELKKNGIKQLRITLNHPQVHELWSGRKRENARKAIKKSIEEGFYTTINYLVSKSSLERMPQICDEAIDLGAGEVNFLNYIYMNRAESMPNEVLSPKDISRFHQLLDQLKSKYPKKDLYLDRLGMFGPGLNPKDLLKELVNQGKFCWAGEGPHGKYYFIETDNKIYPCLSLCGPELQIGKIVNGEIEITRNPLKKFHRKTCYCMHRALNVIKN